MIWALILVVMINYLWILPPAIVLSFILMERKVNHSKERKYFKQILKTGQHSFKERISTSFIKWHYWTNYLYKALENLVYLGMRSLSTINCSISKPFSETLLNNNKTSDRMNKIIWCNFVQCMRKLKPVNIVLNYHRSSFEITEILSWVWEFHNIK